MKSKLEIIKETREYYENHPERRSVSEGGNCFYMNYEEGQFCAVGRCLKEDARIRIAKSGKNSDSFESLISEIDFKELFKPEYLIEDEDFWGDLQAFHDSKRFWGDNGFLTAEGEEYYEGLVADYS